MNIEKIESIDELGSRELSGNLNGVYWVNEDHYHQGPGLSSSNLKHLLRSPAHYIQSALNPSDSKALTFGRAVHFAVLEPEKFSDKYMIAEKIDRRTTAGKLRQEEIDAMTGVTWLSQDDHDQIAGISFALLTNQKFRNTLNGSKAELSAYWVDENTGILCKARADIIKNGVIYDLKTTTDASEQNFIRSVINYKYHLSAAWYIHGFKRFGMADKHFAWFAVEKDPPNGIRIYSASERLLEIGLNEALHGLKVYSASKITDKWPCYDDAVTEIDLPTYYNFIKDSE